MTTTETPADPYADRYEDEPDADALPPRPRRRRVTPAVLVLCGVAIGAAGFAAGVEVQKGESAAPAGAARAGGFPGGGQMPGGAGGQIPGGGGQMPGGFGDGTRGGAGGGMTVGEVTAKKGRTLYVQTTDGTTVKVTTNSSSAITRTAATSAKGVYPGDTVMVTGAANAKGTVAATSVRATAASASTR